MSKEITTVGIDELWVDSLPDKSVFRVSFKYPFTDQKQIWVEMPDQNFIQFDFLTQMKDHLIFEATKVCLRSDLIQEQQKELVILR